MATFNKGMGGPAILDGLKTKLGEIGTEMRVMSERRDVPADYRAETLRERTAEARLLRDEAARAIREWAADEVADARRRYRSDPVASAAEETRRNTIELRLGQIVQTARAEDARLGPRFAAGSGRPVNNASAWGLADRAEQAWLDGDYVEAQLYARASTDLGGPDRAALVFQRAQAQLDQEHPTRRQALKDIANAERGLALFDRDSSAAIAGALQDAARLAQSVGDRAAIQTLATEAARASMAAKMAEFARSQAAGDAYASPEGTLASAPAARESDLDRATRRAYGS